MRIRSALPEEAWAAPKQANARVVPTVEDRGRGDAEPGADRLDDLPFGHFDRAGVDLAIPRLTDSSPACHEECRGGDDVQGTNGKDSFPALSAPSS